MNEATLIPRKAVANPVSVDVPDTSPLVEQAKTLAIVSQADADAAGAMRQGIKALRVQIESTFGPIKQKAKAAHTEACEQEARYLDPLERADAMLAEKMKGYVREFNAVALEGETLAISGSVVKSNWKFRVLDLAKVPDEYFTLDEKALTALAKKQKASAVVAGIEFFDDVTIAVK